ncbi:MAG TPA: PQQ-dependent dehydrogenase, methanol/ethanol family [Devosia sp.]|nr:PQQ-dependent dehydrogenase, methanol/ethanol family [Devosia sp.]
MTRGPFGARAACALLLALSACTGDNGAAGSAASGTIAGDEWTNPGGGDGKLRYSGLADITPGNVSKLGLAWDADLGTGRGMEATPVFVNGTLYTSGMAGRVYAFDGASGEELWRFEPEIDNDAWRSACCDAVNRGIAIRDGLLYVAALDGKLYALDAATGKIRWQADTVEDHTRGITSTGAPELAGDVVVIGNGGAEYDVRGYVTAYDAATGAQRWRFHTVPRNPGLGPQDHPDLEPAVKTWDANSRWDIGGGGTPWDAINYDPLTGLVLVGTGNGGPYHQSNRSPSGGDNLYLSSIVALDPASGRVKWHYQETPGDNWDYTATAPMILTEMEFGGEKRPVVIHAPKNGFLYILDRRDGKLLSAKPIAYMNWADGVDMKTGRPNIRPDQADYSKGPKIVFPASVGARNWQPGSYDPESGLYIAPVVELGNLIVNGPVGAARRPRALNNNASLIFSTDVDGLLPTFPPETRKLLEAQPAMQRVREKPWTSALKAIDPKTGKTVWSQEMDGWQDRGGTLATAGGLVFQGNLAGALRVFDSRTGKLLHRIETGRSILAAPMTYRIDGVQYVAVTTGWGGGGWPYVPPYSAAYKYGNENHLLVFRLDGKPVTMPSPLPPLAPAAAPPRQEAGITPSRIAHGRTLFFDNCAICHSNQPRSISPDLRRMNEGTHLAFKEVVLRGLLLSNGMPRWDDLLSERDVEDIHAYLIEEQRATHAREAALVRQGKALDAPVATIMSNY